MERFLNTPFLIKCMGLFNIRLFGKKLFRTPNIKKRINDRLSVKKQLINRTGLKMPKGLGIVRNPKKYVYNKLYNAINKKLI